jgi:hypothetical protein
MGTSSTDGGEGGEGEEVRLDTPSACVESGENQGLLMLNLERGSRKRRKRWGER